jgi:hypothetical protein
VHSLGHVAIVYSSLTSESHYSSIVGNASAGVWRTKSLACSICISHTDRRTKNAESGKERQGPRFDFLRKNDILKPKVTIAIFILCKYFILEVQHIAYSIQVLTQVVL